MAAKYSMSLTKGAGNLRHNQRKQERTPAHVDTARTPQNVEIVRKDVREFYDETFSESVAEYNRKQREKGRKSREIKDYYMRVENDGRKRQGRGQHGKAKTFYELILQLGNETDRPDPKTAEAVYRDFVTEFQKRYPQMGVVGAYVHYDEATTHLHLDYVPVAVGGKPGKRVNGPYIHVNNNLAIEQMGFKNWKSWRKDAFQLLEEISARYDIQRQNMNNSLPHENTQLYKAAKDAVRQEAAEKEASIASAKQKVEDELDQRFRNGLNQELLEETRKKQEEWERMPFVTEEDIDIRKESWFPVYTEPGIWLRQSLKRKYQDLDPQAMRRVIADRGSWQGAVMEIPALEFDSWMQKKVAASLKKLTAENRNLEKKNAELQASVENKAAEALREINGYGQVRLSDEMILADTARLRAEIDDLKKLQEENADLTERCSLLTAEKDRLEEENRNLNKELDEQDEYLSEKDQAYRELSDSFKELKKDNARLKTDNRKKEGKLITASRWIRKALDYIAHTGLWNAFLDALAAPGDKEALSDRDRIQKHREAYLAKQQEKERSRRSGVVSAAVAGVGEMLKRGSQPWSGTTVSKEAEKDDLDFGG